MKRLHEGSFRTAWGGIASLSVALPLMWTEASRRGFTLLDLARWMAAAPARLAGCDTRKGKIAVGYDADFVIFDSDLEFVVTPDRLHYRTSDLSVSGRNAARRGEGYLSARESRLRRRKVSRQTVRTGILPCVIIIDRLDKAHQLLPHNFRDVEARSGLHYPIRGSWLPAGPQMNSDRIVDSIIGKSVPRKEGRTRSPEGRSTSTTWLCHTCSSERRFAARFPRVYQQDHVRSGNSLG